MGTITQADGTLALDALHVSAWGGVQSAGNIIGNIAGGLYVASPPPTQTDVITDETS